MARLVQTPAGPLLVAEEALPPDIQARVAGLPTVGADLGGGGGGVGVAGLAGSALGSALPGVTDAGLPPSTEESIARSVGGVSGPHGSVMRPPTFAAGEPFRVGLPRPGPLGRGEPERAQSAPTAGDEELFAGRRPPPGAGPAASAVQDAVSSSVETRTKVAARSGGGGGGGFAREVDRGVEEQRQGLAIQGAARARGAADRAEEFGRLEADLVSQRDESDRRLAMIEEKKAEAREKIAASEQKLGAFSLDPNRIFRDRTSEQRVLGAIGMLLTAAGDAMHKTTGTASRILNDAIERDVETQRVEYDKLKGQVAGAHSLYAFWRQEGFDERDALASAVASAKEITAVRIDAIANRATAAEQKGVLLQASGALRAQAADTKHGIEARNAGLAMQRESLELNKLDLATRLEGATGVPSTLLVPGAEALDGGPAVARTAQEAQNASKVIASYRQVTEQLNRLKALRDKHGAVILNRRAVQEGESAAAFAQATFKGPELFGLGVLSDSDFEFLDKAIPSNPLRVGFVRSQLDEAQRYIDGKVAAWLSAHGRAGLRLQRSARPDGFSLLEGAR